MQYRFHSREITAAECDLIYFLPQIYCLTLVEDKGDATGFSVELPDRVITLTHRGGDMDLEKPKGRQSGKINRPPSGCPRSAPHL